VIFRSLKKLFNSFLGGGERFLVVEIENNRLSVSKISINWQDKEIKILDKRTSGAGWLEDAARAFSFLQKISKRIPRLASYKVIFVLEPRLATTKHVSTKIIREEGRKIIDEADLDNLISQAIWQVFDKERGLAADKMFLDDLDVLLADVKIRNLKIDGHHVINPLGFTAKTVEIFLSQTFAPRDFFETMRSLFPSNQFVLISEAGSLGADVLARFYGCGGIKRKNSGDFAFVFANLNSVKSDVYGVLAGESDVHKIWYLDSFDMGRNDFYANFGKHFMLPAHVAEDVVWRCARGEVSSFFAVKLEKIMRKEWAAFCGRMASVISGSREFKNIKNIQIFMRAEEGFPEVLYSETARLRDGRKIEIVPVILSDVVSRLGFSVVSKKHAIPFFPVVGILSMHCYLDDWLNKIANRRLRWLTPEPKKD